MMIHQGQLSIYLHWPFCLAKCPYCDFNVHVRDEIDFARFESAYLRSLSWYRERLGDRIVHSIYFGGGTPSIMPADMVERILTHIRGLWPMSNACEITLEANPTSVEADKFEAFKDAGVNRVSIGVQALNDADLHFLGRKHSRDDALRALEIAHSTFERFSFDLIYGRPSQSLKSWEAELSEACALAKGHLSLYQLTIERNTPFYFDHAQEKFSLPREELAADFYLLTDEVTRAHGLSLYEVSNHAADEDDQSAHNLQYWRSGEYIGVGSGAHGRIDLDGRRLATRDHYAPEKWLEWVEDKGQGAHAFECVNHASLAMEAVMMGLRVTEGFPFARIDHLTGRAWQDFINEDRLRSCAEQGWLNFDEMRVVLSREGMLRLNAIVPFILKDQEKAGRAA